MSPNLVSRFNFIQNGHEWPKGLGKEKTGIVSAEDLVGYFHYTVREDAQLDGEKSFEFKDGYFGYTSRDNASVKTFSNYGWLETEEQINQFREEIYDAFNYQDALAWLPIQSYKDYVTAAQYGLFNAEDYAAITSKVLSKFYKRVGLEESNMLWWMDYHHNKDHPHVHLVFLEREQTRTRGMFTQKEIDYFKGQLFNEMKIREQIINKTYQLDLDGIHKNGDEKKLLKEHFAELLNHRRDKEISKLLDQLRTKLPKTGRLQYGSSHMIPYRKDIDLIVQELLNHPEIIEQYDQLLQQWKFMDEEKSRELHTQYTDVYDQETMKLHKQLANAVLELMKDYQPDNSLVEGHNEEHDHDVNLGEINDDELDIYDMIQQEVPSFFEDSFEDARSDIEEKNYESNDSPKFVLEWNDRYKQALNYFYGSEEVKKDLDKALDLLELEAEQGNVLAIHDLGKLHTIDNFKDIEKSDAYFQQAHDGFKFLLNNKEEYESELVVVSKKKKTNTKYIQYRLGKLYHHGLGCDKDIGQAITHYEQANNNQYALYALGFIYEYQKEEKDHLNKSNLYYERASKLGNPFASYALGRQLGDSDKEKSHSYYSMALDTFRSMIKERSDDSICFRAGSMLIDGKGCEVDIQEGLKLLDHSIQLNNSMAKLKFVKTVDLYHLEDKQTEAEKYQRELIEKEHPESLIYFGTKGIHSEVNVQEGIDLLLKLPEDKIKNYTHYLLYTAYKKLNNQSEAYQHLLKAVQMNHVNAHFEMAKLFEQSHQRMLSNHYYQEYLKLELKEPSKKRNSAIWNRLGSIYEYGKGTRVNENNALKCYRKGLLKQDQYSDQSIIKFTRLVAKRNKVEERLEAMDYLKINKTIDHSEAKFWIGRLYMCDPETRAEGRRLVIEASLETKSKYIKDYTEHMQERMSAQNSTETEYLKHYTKQVVNGALRKVDYEIERNVEQAQEDYYERSEHFS